MNKTFFKSFCFASLLAFSLGTSASYVPGNTPGTPTQPTVYLTSNTTSLIKNATSFKGANGTGTVNTTNFSWEGGHPIQAGGQTPKNTAGVFDNGICYNANSYTRVHFHGTFQSFELTIASVGETTQITDNGNIIYDGSGYSVTGTAQGGTLSGGTSGPIPPATSGVAAGTITLASTSNTSNGFYNQNYITITGGTGAGQIQQITQYNGSTFVATVAGPWTTAPDSTSTYGISAFTPQTQPVVIPSDSTFRLLGFNFGTVSTHDIVISRTAPFYSINVDSDGTVEPGVPFSTIPVFISWDSFGEGAGQQGRSYFHSAAYLTAIAEGLMPWLDVCGTTGFVGPSPGTETGRAPYPIRITPPVNSWQVDQHLVNSNGTYTLSQVVGGTTITTASITTGSTYTTIQPILDAAFGSGVKYVYQNQVYGPLIIDLQNPTSTNPMTISGTGNTGTLSIFQWTGVIAPNVPANNAPFFIWPVGSVNDAQYSQYGSTVQTLFQTLTANYPQACEIGSGIPMVRSPVTNSTQLSGQLTLMTALTASVQSCHGQQIILKTYDANSGDSNYGLGYLTGASNASLAAGASGTNSDCAVSSDSTHPDAVCGVDLLFKNYDSQLHALLYPNGGNTLFAAQQNATGQTLIPNGEIFTPTALGSAPTPYKVETDATGTALYFTTGAGVRQKLGIGTLQTVAGEGSGQTLVDTSTSTGQIAYLYSITAGSGIVISTPSAGNIVISATGGSGGSGTVSGVNLTCTAPLSCTTTNPTGNVALTAALGSIAAENLLANPTSSSAVPVATTFTNFLDNALGANSGAIIYRSTSAWTETAANTATTNQYCKENNSVLSCAPIPSADLATPLLTAPPIEVTTAPTTTQPAFSELYTQPTSGSVIQNLITTGATGVTAITPASNAGDILDINQPTGGSAYFEEFAVNGVVKHKLDNTGKETDLIFASSSNGAASNVAYGIGSSTTGWYNTASTNIDCAISSVNECIFSSTGLDLPQIGEGLRVAEGTNGRQGVATLATGTATVSNTSITSTTRIMLTEQDTGTCTGFVKVSARTAGTSFSITSSVATDTCTVAYELFEPG